MWTEARNDSKLDALNDREFRIWWKLLCYSAEGEPRGQVDYIDPEFVAMELRLGADELDAAISRMVRLRLIERSDATVIFPAFEDRQYDKPSDKPDAVKERVRRSREKAREGSNALSRDVSRREEKNREEKNRGGVGDSTGSDVSVDNSDADPKAIAEIMAKFRADLEARAGRD